MADIKNIEFKWGTKRGLGGRRKNVQFYESFTYDGLHYTLYDDVYLHKEGQPSPYLGKLIKIWENTDKSKKVKVLWYFKPCEVSNHLEVELIHPNEVFLASGEGVGLANVNPLEALAGKCNVVCISKDSRNPQPSDEDLQMADFVFCRTFDVNQCVIGTKIDDTVAGVDVKFIFNRVGSLKPSSIHDVGDKHGGETAIETNEKVILSNKLNSSEKPVVGEKLDADKIGSSIEVKENKDLKVDEELKSIEDLGELDERPHKKAKLDCSGKDSNDENNNGVLMPSCDSDRNDSKPLVSDIIASEDEPRCATSPNGTSENYSMKLKVGDDELAKPNSELLNESSPWTPNDGIKTGDKAVEVTSRPDISSSRETITLGRSYTQRGIKDDHSKPKWTTFLKKFRRERKKIFSSGGALQASYDPDEYSQNFDQGTGWAEPDNLSRSFSARFADPSRISRTKC